MLVTIAEVAEKSFDYVVIGGGTAGLALACRLSEDVASTVLVLEAGEENLNDPTILVPGPGNRRILRNNPKYDWCLETVAQEHSNDKKYQWSRGKGLGGSSALNVLLWNKSDKRHINAFEELGNPGWNWEAFQKYSKKAERFVEPDHDLDVLTFDHAYHGDSGKIVTSFPSLISNLERPMFEALAARGISRITDSSSGHPDGAGSVPLTLDPATHHRTYSANTYLSSASSRQNLKVLVASHVLRVRTSANTDGTITATAVEFMHHDNTYAALCTREVCVCAGAVMSPQILELSGIGDPSILKKAGIDPKVSLPGVGANVQEHLFAPMTYELKVSSHNDYDFNTYDPLLDPSEAKKHMQLLPEGKGLFNLCTISLTFVPVSTVCADISALQSTLADTIEDGVQTGHLPSGLKKQYEIQLRHLEEKVPSVELILGPGMMALPSKPDATKKHLTLGLGLNNPFSRGTIHIMTSDPLVPPAIDPHMFEKPFDLYTMVEALKFLRCLAKTEPLKTILHEHDLHPGPHIETDEQIAEWIKGAVSTTFHTVGSCSMIPEEDGGVVDSNLLVYHTTNIRVVDLSIVPLQIGAHPQSLVYAIAEQAADILRGHTMLF